MRYGFGVDIGGTTVKIAWFEESGKKLCSWEIPTVRENNGAQILPDIAASLLGYIKKNNIPMDSLLGIGIGVPGPVNAQGVVNKCVNLGWGVFNIAEDLGKLVGFPVKAGNDANVAAMGEYWQGSGREFGSMIMATLGTGVGGGIMGVIPGRMGIGVYAPSLDKHGNSKAGVQVLAQLSRELDLGIF